MSRVLVAYASRHGATRGIAERVAGTLTTSGLDVTVQRIEDAGMTEPFDAFVIGSSAYVGHWEKAAAEFVRRHALFLAARPVWLFSSGPIGAEQVDKRGRDVREASRPVEFAEFESLIHPRDTAVFFGAYDPDAPPIGIAERLTAAMPFIRKAIPAGDFRDWPAIEAWAKGIARELATIQDRASVPA